MKYKQAGIYGLYNVIDNKIYIGKSQNIFLRLKAHAENFEQKNGGNEMYMEPIENFVFLVIHEMTQEEYARFGDLVESLLIASALRDGLPVYNKAKVKKDMTFEALVAFGLYDSITDAVRGAVGVTPRVVNLMSEVTRRNRLKSARENWKPLANIGAIW